MQTTIKWIAGVVGAIALVALAAYFYMGSKADQSQLDDTQAELAASPKLLAAIGKPRPTIEASRTTASFDPNIINGIKVPPMPDEKLNNATLAGIDSDGNGVRDDVDRLIAEIFGNEPKIYKLAKEFAVAEQSIITVGSKTSIDNYTKLIICTDLVYEKRIDQLTNLSLNTESRAKAYELALAGEGGSVSEERCKK